MIDAKTVAQELEQARLIRQAAETACSDVEELLGEMQRGPAVWRRLALTEGADDLHLMIEIPPPAAPQAMALAA